MVPGVISSVNVKTGLTPCPYPSSIFPGSGPYRAKSKSMLKIFTFLTIVVVNIKFPLYENP
jgi:hypothetical protein